MYNVHLITYILGPNFVLILVFLDSGQERNPLAGHMDLKIQDLKETHVCDLTADKVSRLSQKLSL
jgi:hypothetical protein